jgi:alkylhydroperoxidase family enzyme
MPCVHHLTAEVRHRGGGATLNKLPALHVYGLMAALARNEVDDDRHAALAAHLDERGIIELSLVSAHYLMLARIMSALRIDPGPPLGPEKLLRR